MSNKPNIYEDIKKITNILYSINTKLDEVDNRLNIITKEVEYLKKIITDIGRKCDYTLNKKVNISTVKKSTK